MLGAGRVDGHCRLWRAHLLQIARDVLGAGERQAAVALGIAFGIGVANHDRTCFAVCELGGDASDRKSTRLNFSH